MAITHEDSLIFWEFDYHRLICPLKCPFSLSLARSRNTI